MTSSDRSRGGRKKDATEEARNAALRLLTVRSRSVAEIRRRLGRKGFEDKVVEAVVAGLRRSGLLDDEAFAREWVRERLARKPRGRFALVQELRKKGVESAVAEEAIEAIFREEGIDEAEVARRAAERWLGRRSRATRDALCGREGREKGERARRRLYGALVRKGFPREVARGVLEGLVRRLEAERESENRNPPQRRGSR